MTLSPGAPALLPERLATTRRYLMCRPRYFAVRYTINPWMDPDRPVDVARADAQWSALRATYQRLGHRVELIEPDPELPDMVFAANGAVVVGGRAVAARFRYPERAAEADRYAAALARLGVAPVARPRYVSEGEGDFLLVGERLLAGFGFRSDRRGHAEIQRHLGVPVVSLQLVDPRYYHLDTALGVLDERTIAYLPEAFAPASRRQLQQLYPDAIRARPADAAVLGLNLVSDGAHVVLPAAAGELAATIAARGFTPIPVELDELLKAGGGPKCTTLELRTAPPSG